MEFQARCVLAWGAWITAALGLRNPILSAQEWVEPGSWQVPGWTVDTLKTPGEDFLGWQPVQGEDRSVDPALMHASRFGNGFDGAVVLPEVPGLEGEGEALLVAVESTIPGRMPSPVGIHAYGLGSGRSAWKYNSGMGDCSWGGPTVVGPEGEERVVLRTWTRGRPGIRGPQSLLVLEGRSGSLLARIFEPFEDAWSGPSQAVPIPDADGDGFGDFGLLLEASIQKQPSTDARVELYSGRTLESLYRVYLKTDEDHLVSANHWRPLPDLDGDGRPEILAYVVEARLGWKWNSQPPSSLGRIFSSKTGEPLSCTERARTRALCVDVEPDLALVPVRPGGSSAPVTGLGLLIGDDQRFLGSLSFQFAPGMRYSGSRTLSYGGSGRHPAILVYWSGPGHVGGESRGWFVVPRKLWAPD